MNDNLLRITIESISVFREYVGDNSVTTQNVLMFLHVCVKGSVAQNDFMTLLGMEQPAVTKNAAKLRLKQGLLADIGNPHDARSNLLILTKKGEELKAKILSRSERLYQPNK